MFLEEKSGGWRPLGRPRYRRKDNIKMIFRLIQVIHMTPGQESGKN
jgi:hypothetical protein